MPTICVSIVSTAQNHLVRDLLNDLNSLANGLQLTVILRHNLPEETAGDFDGFKLIEVWNDRRKGFAANHNLNFDLCEQDVFMVVNPDVRIFQIESLSVLANAALFYQTVVAPSLQGKNDNIQDHRRPPLTIRSLISRHFLSQRDLTEHWKPYFWVSGMFMVFPRTLFLNINGFDEKFFLYCEDADICARAAIAGHHVIVLQNVSVIHNAQYSSRSLNVNTLIHCISLITFLFSKVARQANRLNLRPHANHYINHVSTD